MDSQSGKEGVKVTSTAVSRVEKLHEHFRVCSVGFGRAIAKIGALFVDWPSGVFILGFIGYGAWLTILVFRPEQSRERWQSRITSILKTTGTPILSSLNGWSDSRSSMDILQSSLSSTPDDSKIAEIKRAYNTNRHRYTNKSRMMIQGKALEGNHIIVRDRNSAIEMKIARTVTWSSRLIAILTLLSFAALAGWNESRTTGMASQQHWDFSLMGRSISFLLPTATFALSEFPTRRILNWWQNKHIDTFDMKRDTAGLEDFQEGMGAYAKQHAPVVTNTKVESTNVQSRAISIISTHLIIYLISYLIFYRVQDSASMLGFFVPVMILTLWIVATTSYIIPDRWPGNILHLRFDALKHIPDFLDKGSDIYRAPSSKERATTNSWGKVFKANSPSSTGEFEYLAKGSGKLQTATVAKNQPEIMKVYSRAIILFTIFIVILLPLLFFLPIFAAEPYQSQVYSANLYTIDFHADPNLHLIPLQQNLVGLRYIEKDSDFRLPKNPMTILTPIIYILLLGFILYEVKNS